MKHENETIRALIDQYSPNNEQISRMEQNILAQTTPSHKCTRKLHLLPFAAALMVMAIGITVISASPAIRKYFFPGAGIIEMTDDGTAESAPLYLMLNTESDTGTDFECLYGCWYDGSAKFWIRSETRYEDLDAQTLFSVPDASITLQSVQNLTNNPEQVYQIEIPSLSWEDAVNGITFGTGTVRFSRMPLEYHPYTVEDVGLRLTLIPLTADFTTFAAEMDYLDTQKTGELQLQTHSIYNQHAGATEQMTAMRLIDSSGKQYPLVQYGDNDIFHITETPTADIIGFRADTLIISGSFSEDTLVSVPLPADGESIICNLDFTYPDEITKGRIYAAGCNNAIVETQHIDQVREFPMGYFSFIVEALEQDGIQYWAEMTYTQTYEDYLSQFTVMEEKSPYDMTINSMSPRTQFCIIGMGEKVSITQHYIRDETDAVTLRTNSYTAIANGNWAIDFAASE